MAARAGNRRPGLTGDRTSMALPDDELVTCTAGTLRDSVRIPYGDLRRLAGAVPLTFAEKERQ